MAERHGECRHDSQPGHTSPRFHPLLALPKVLDVREQTTGYGDRLRTSAPMRPYPRMNLRAHATEPLPQQFYCSLTSKMLAEPRWGVPENDCCPLRIRARRPALRLAARRLASAVGSRRRGRARLGDPPVCRAFARTRAIQAAGRMHHPAKKLRCPLEEISGGIPKQYELHRPLESHQVLSEQPEVVDATAR